MKTRLIIKATNEAGVVVAWLTVDVESAELEDALSWANGIHATVVGSELLKEEPK